MARMVAAGIGIGIMPSAAAAPLVNAMGLRVARISGMHVHRALLLGMRDRRSLSAAAREFVELVEKRLMIPDKVAGADAIRTASPTPGRSKI